MDELKLCIETVAPMGIPFPPCGEGCGGLASVSELSGSWMGGGAARAARARESAKWLGPQRCITPHPNLPPQGGKGSKRASMCVLSEAGI
jgi:hypothetical protein